ncbi:ABC transporter permease subunit [Paraburkholderia sp.]|uniref:ABC transporter permease subunit n=1 Tax=Paraburkholderia sp. TaxID=1926495 RepID=UPI003D6F7E71
MIAALGAGLFGSVLAILAGHFGGWVDRTISYLVDLWMSFPPVVLSLVLMVSLGVGVETSSCRSCWSTGPAFVAWYAPKSWWCASATMFWQLS